MKTKIFILFIFFMAFCVSIHAQFGFGIRAGISSTTIKLKDVSNQDYELDYGRGDFGYQFGFIGQVKILKFFVQPELLYSISKADISYNSLALGDTTKYGRQVFHSIDLPVMVGIKLGVLKLELGPVLSYNLKSKSSLLDDYNIDQEIKQATIGYQVGLGVELSKLLIDVKYEGNLSKFGAGMDIGNTRVNFDQRMNKWVVGLGYLF